MKKRSGIFYHSSLLLFVNLALLCSLAAVQPALAQNIGITDPGQSTAWATGAIAHAQRMRRYPDRDNGAQPTPPIIPKFELDTDPGGVVGTFQPSVSTITSNNAFFQNLGTNERTCFTCHQPATDWTISAASVQARFKTSGGQDPIFRLVDGATCPTDDVSTPAAKQQAYKLLLGKGLIRIGLPMPANAQFSVINVQTRTVARRIRKPG
jgi:hypothetical protein